jgi:hypothetical protein
MVSPLWVVDIDGIPLEDIVNNVSPLGVVDIVSSLSVVEMVCCRTPSVTGNIHLT